MDGESRRTQMNHGRRAAAVSMAIGLSATLVVAGCTRAGTADSAPRPEPVATIDQPVVGDLLVAPSSRRVDLTMPRFSDPTTITNSLFPVSRQESVLMLGKVDGEDFRTEVTLLPETRIIEWNGQRVEVVVSQYVAYLDGRLHEVAYDLYAQDDNGAVWYFGEDVFNFKDGAIVDTHGTWIAGMDGPAAMIMPADPAVGDVYRPENIPGLVFEEVTVKAVGEALDGPLGPIDGGLVIEELHMDGFTEGKTFAPGYGEFYTAGGGDVEALALAVPTDAVSEPVPAELETLSSEALAVFDAVGSGRWQATSALLGDVTAAWKGFPDDDVPNRMEPRMSAALRSLARAVDTRTSAAARQAAIDVAQSSFDLQLRYRPAAQIDLARFDLWLAQLMTDAEAGDPAAVNGDFFVLDYIRDRIIDTLDPSAAVLVNTRLEELLGPVGDGDLDTAARVAERLRDTLTGLLQPAR
jgi:hypothetical protein